MAVPEYHRLMLPLLRIASDGKEHNLSEAIELLAKEFNLSEADRNEILPSGRQSKFDNRVGWARTYLKKAVLLESTGRAKFKITSRGVEVLKSNPPLIDSRFLMQFPEFVEFKTIPVQDEAEPHEELAQQEQTPEELLETSYQSLRRNLAQDLLERAKRCSPRFFEQLVVDLLVAMGYGGSRADAGQAVGRSGDGGIDGIIKEDKLGLDFVYVQAKRWEGTVGRPVVQGFAGSLEGVRARKGVLITTSQFSQEAKDYASKIEKRIVLIDGDRLAQLMIEYGVGVTEVAAYHVKKPDLDYFGDDE